MGNCRFFMEMKDRYYRGECYAQKGAPLVYCDGNECQCECEQYKSVTDNVKTFSTARMWLKAQSNGKTYALKAKKENNLRIAYSKKSGFVWYSSYENAYIKADEHDMFFGFDNFEDFMAARWVVL